MALVVVTLKFEGDFESERKNHSPLYKWRGQWQTALEAHCQQVGGLTISGGSIVVQFTTTPEGANALLNMRTLTVCAQTHKLATPPGVEDQRPDSRLMERLGVSATDLREAGSTLFSSLVVVT